MSVPDAQLTRLPPQSIEAEQAALGAMLLERDAIVHAVDALEPDDFYREAHRVLYQCILDMYQLGETADIVTLSEHLKTKGKLEEVGGTLYLSTLISQVPTAAAIGHYAGIIRAKSLQRHLIRAADSIMNDAYRGDQELEHLLDSSEQRIFAVAERNERSGVLQLREALRSQFYAIEDATGAGGPGGGISTHFAELDAITAGLHPTDLVILAARPSMGKTAFALNIARNIAVNERQPVLLFSVEMSRDQLATRLMCTEAQVPMDTVRHGQANDEDLRDISQAVERLWDVPIYIDDSAMLSVMEMRGRCRRLKAQLGSLGLVVVDYIQLMHAPGRWENNRVQEIAVIARGLKALAREMEVPVLALSQLSRLVESRSPRRPQLSDLRESGAIEQDADLVMFLYRPDYYGDEELKRVGLDPLTQRDVTELIVAKQRNGPTGTLRVGWDKEHGQFYNMEGESARTHR